MIVIRMHFITQRAGDALNCINVQRSVRWTVSFASLNSEVHEGVWTWIAPGYEVVDLGEIT